MREDAVQYHRRVIDEFVNAVINKQDAHEEAVNLLMSANNLENNGFTRILLKREAEEYLEPSTVLSQSTSATRDVFSSARGDTLQERAPTRHHKQIPQFDEKKLLNAIENNAEKALDKLVSRFVGWRMQTMQNPEREGDVVGSRSKLDTLHLFPHREGKASFGTMPLFQHLTRYLFGGEGENAERLHKAMVKTAKKMHPKAKEPHMFSDWVGNNATMMRFFNIGYNDFKRAYLEKFPKMQKFFADPQAINHYIRVKNWENEGIPRDEVMDVLFKENGMPRQVYEDKKQSPVQWLSQVADQHTDQRRAPKDDERNFGRVGLDAYRLGIAMLPYSQIYNIMKWMLVTNGGMDSDGNINDSFINKRYGSDMRGYMAHHAYLMDNMIDTLYAGGSGRNGYNQTLPNQYTKKYQAEISTNLEKRSQDMKEQLAENNWKGLAPETIERAVEYVNFDNLVKRFAQEHDADIIDEAGRYPHIKRDEQGDTIYMTDEPPDLRSLILHNFFTDDEKERIVERTLVAYGQQEFADLLRQSVQGYTHTHNTEDEFDMLEEPQFAEPSPPGSVMQGVGSRRGNASGETGDIINTRDEAFGNVFRAPLPQRTFLMPSRPERDATGAKKTVEQKDVYDPAKDVDGSMIADLEEALETRGVENQEEVLERFKRGEAVSVDMPRQSLSLEEAIRRGGIADPDGVAPQEALKDYLKGMPSPRTPATQGLHSFFMAHSDFLNSGDMDDFVGFLSLDGKKRRGSRVALDTPMLGLRKERIRAQKSDSRKRYEARHAPGYRDKKKTDKARKFGYEKGQLHHEDRLLIDFLLHGSHLPLHEFDDNALKQFQDLLREDHEDRFSALKNMNHRDVIGVGGRDGRNMVDEIVRGYEPPSQLAIYFKEDLDEYIKNQFKMNEPYSLPPTQSSNIRTRRGLLQELKTLDMQYLNAKNEQEKGKRASELEQFIRMQDIREEKGAPLSSLHQHGTEEEPAVSSLVVAPSPSYLASVMRAELSKAMRIADQSGDNNTKELIERKLSQVRRVAPPEDGGEAQFNNEEKRLRNEVQTVNATAKIFKAIRPAIEKLFPNVFTEGNDKAYTANAMGLKIAEEIAMLDSDEREQVFNNGVFYGGQNIPFDYLSDDEKYDLKNMYVSREVHKNSQDMAEKALDLQFGGEQPRGHEAASKLSRREGSGVSNDDIEIFEAVMESVKEAANKQDGVGFEKAFMSRYHPHDLNGKPVRGNLKSIIYEQLQSHEGFRRNPSRFQFNNGGVFHELAQDQLTSGGETVQFKGQPISMRREREAIVNVLQHAHRATRAGSDIAMDFKRTRSFGQRKGATAKQHKKVMNFNKPNSLENIAALLHDRTGTQLLDESSVETEPQIVMGGYNMNNAHASPINTCGEGKFHYGIEGTRAPPFVHQSHHLGDGRLVLETDDLHTFNAPTPQVLRMNIHHMRNANPDLQPLDVSKPLTYFPYQAFQGANTNMRLGQGVNAATMTAGEDLAANDQGIFTYSSHLLDVALDDTLLIKDDGKPQPVKSMHRIFDLDDMQHLRGFTGDWVISLHPQGEHVIATKDKKGITAYGVDGEVKLDEVFSEEADKVYENDFTVHAILHDGLMTVIDLLKTADEDTHNMPTKDRIRHLRAQYESSEHIKMPEPINTKRSDDEGLQVAIDGLRNENEAVDILLRDANATYMKGESRHPKWVLMSKEKKVDVIILSASGTTYGIGVGPLMHPEHYGKRAQQVGEEHYMNVGSAKGPRGLKVGDFATVRCTGVSASKKEHPVYRIRSAKITDNEPFAANSVETLAIMSGEHHVPQQVSMKKGNITIRFPAFDDEVICKTRKEDGLWYVEPQSSIWGNDYLLQLARDQEPYWITKAAWLLKEQDTEEPEYDEVEPEPPAGHSKKPKKVLEDEEEVIKRGLDLIERGLEHLAKEKITSTGVQGLGMDYATPDESPRGPTQNIRDNTMPDFDPQARADDELKPATGKKTKRLRSSKGETARLEDDGVIAIENSSIDIP